MNTFGAVGRLKVVCPKKWPLLPSVLRLWQAPCNAYKISSRCLLKMPFNSLIAPLSCFFLNDDSNLKYWIVNFHGFRTNLEWACTWYHKFLPPRALKSLEIPVHIHLATCQRKPSSSSWILFLNFVPKMLVCDVLHQRPSNSILLQDALCWKRIGKSTNLGENQISLVGLFGRSTLRDTQHSKVPTFFGSMTIQTNLLADFFECILILGLHNQSWKFINPRKLSKRHLNRPLTANYFMRVG